LEVEFPQMLMPLMVATVLLFSSLLIYGTAIHLIVTVVVRLIRIRPSTLGFWKGTAVMGLVMMITAAAHLVQVALWAVAFFLCGQVSTWEAAFYLSAQSFTALGYGDVPLSEQWRILGPLEAVNGLLFFGVSAAVLFAILSQFIADRLRTETGYPRKAAGNPTPLPAAGDATSE
jgi:Ion channel